MGDDVTIGPFDLAWRADEAIAVQTVAFGLDAEEAAVRRSIVERHAFAAGVRALAAETTGDDGVRRMVGFAYGMPNDPGQWWSTIIRPHLEREGNGHWLDDAFAVTELHVLPDFQHRGIGRTLLLSLLDGVAQRRGILSAVDEETPARRLYRGLGWRDLARRVPFPGTTRVYAVMGVELPLRPPRPPARGVGGG
ncbi:GNAT family N-acetyltransferase [Allostreptomyces psammosilenae]|uniref:Ribosomal protein S18 acetylase RimI-like enzyme n=1 Tax=Allostreptomyces psammosilenae TaxID=1892865 RepID=A0A853A1J5_9ACTN|nr:GNAT family N-acetyltransferase [Allostreptomyces psammosilenae]NYI08436.1 ribosomal protein S18 acetylase RimI-like enzyme [Allostreptomyces psammosilenae]